MKTGYTPSGYPDMHPEDALPELVGHGTPLEQLMRWGFDDEDEEKNPDIPMPLNVTSYLKKEIFWEKNATYLTSLIIGTCEQLEAIHKTKQYDKLETLLDGLFDPVSGIRKGEARLSYFLDDDGQETGLPIGTDGPFGMRLDMLKDMEDGKNWEDD